MATPQGTTFMTLLAVVPPAIVGTGLLLEWTSISSLTLSAKTILSLAYLLLVYKTTYSYFTHPLHRFPSLPDPSFLLGHGLSIMDRPPGARILRQMKQVPNNGIMVFRGFFHLFPTMIITAPEPAMEIFNAHSYDWEKPAPPRRFLRRILGDGLIVVEGDVHKVQRRNVTPAFTGKSIKDLIPLFWKKSFSFTDAIQRESAPHGGSVELTAIASRVTLDIIGLAGLGKDFSTTENSEHELAVQYSRITDPKKGNLPLYFMINMIFPQWLVRKLPIEANRRVADAIFELRRIVGELLAEKAQAMEEKTSEQKDIIAILMRSGKFTNEGLTDQLLTFLAAGHETTASALSWASYLLSKHPEVQARLRRDLQAAFGNLGPDDLMTTDQLDAVPFLDAVCNETLRFYPTVPVTARQAIRETRIGDEVVPKGSVAVISPWALNRSPAVWGPDSETFNPDRWMADGAEAGPKRSGEYKADRGRYGGASSPYALLTFLYGPRSCIGQSFARYELKCLLSVLLLKFEMRLKDPAYVAKPEGAVTIRPMDGLDVVVTPV